MEKNKVLLTDKVTKENLKSPTFKKWVMRVLCFTCILSLALQFAMCVVPLSASAAEDSIVGTWVFRDVISLYVFSNHSRDVTITSYATYYGSSYTSFIGIGTANASNYLFLYLPNGSGVPVYSFSNNTYMNSWNGEIVINNEVDDVDFKTWLKANATKVVEEVYDFTGEYRIFKPTLDINFASTQTVQTYQFDFNIYGGYNADYMSFVSDADKVTMSYSFTDEGSGGLRMMYRQSFGDESGTWLVPRARIIYFQSNPDDPTFQQWLLDNTILVTADSIDVIYDAGYSNGFNDGWTDNIIGDTLNAPIQALNNMVLLETADVTITLGGVIVTMIALSILIVYLKKYAGG